MKKNKRLAFLLSILTFLVLIIVVSSTVFCVQNISIDFMNTTINLTGRESEIIDSASFVEGQNVFFVSKRYHMNKIQQAFPYIKIVNIETVFPSSLVIHAVERQNLITIKAANNTYAICDYELFCTSSSMTYVNTNTSPILVQVQSAQLLDTYSVASELSMNVTIKSYLKRVLNCLYEYKTSAVDLCERIEEIVLEYDEPNQIQIKMRSGLNIVINEVNYFPSTKLNYAFSYYEAPTSIINEGTLYINHDSNNIVRGYYQ